jgi:hypothetical protein
MRRDFTNRLVGKGLDGLASVKARSVFRHVTNDPSEYIAHPRLVFRHARSRELGGHQRSFHFQFITMGRRCFHKRKKEKERLARAQEYCFILYSRTKYQISTTHLTFSNRGTLQPELSIKTHNQIMPYASTWYCVHLRNSGQLGVGVLPVIRSLCDFESGVAWLGRARTVNEDNGAHIVVLHTELRFWRQNFAKSDE